MPIHSRGTALSQNLHDVLGAFGFGADKDELTFVRKGSGVGIDDIVWQLTIGKVRLQRADNRGRIGMSTVHRLCRRYNGSKDGSDRNWTDGSSLIRVFCHRSVIMNNAFKSRGSQLFVGSFQVLGVVEYPDYDGFYIHR